MSDKPTKTTKAELREMLAQAVRNTQPQPSTGATQPDHPILDAQPELKKARSAVKRTTKAKRVRASVRRKERRR
jgi:hypothetical protein